jgi:hypothetical protein
VLIDVVLGADLILARNNRGDVFAAVDFHATLSGACSTSTLLRQKAPDWHGALGSQDTWHSFGRRSAFFAMNKGLDI